MFQIFAIVLFVTTGQYSLLTSQEAYSTREACEAKLAERLEGLKKAYDGQEVQVDGKCDVDGQPT